MTDQNQAAQEQPATLAIRIGFEAALDYFNPQWRTQLTVDQVNAYRFFYQSAMRDLAQFVGAAKQTMDHLIQGFQFMDQNAATTTNEVVDPATKSELISEAKPSVAVPVQEVKTKSAAKGKAKVKRASKDNEDW